VEGFQRKSADEYLMRAKPPHRISNTIEGTILSLPSIWYGLTSIPMPSCDLRSIRLGVCEKSSPLHQVFRAGCCGSSHRNRCLPEASIWSCFSRLARLGRNSGKEKCNSLGKIVGADLDGPALVDDVSGLVPRSSLAPLLSLYLCSLSSMGPRPRILHRPQLVVTFWFAVALPMSLSYMASFATNHLSPLFASPQKLI
jgi:hypothetical protein